ncbi:MAG: MAPEG family protein [Proteobacteria bacterium]|nr:MAPEG family protein [Pseudomonadota bacterium]MCP4922206.1 MAPEG family protein [Pseudomonadota bacterium]
MSPLVPLICFALWAPLLVLAVGGHRVLQVLKGNKKPNGFNSGTQHGPDWYWRLNRAHMNTVENLPVFAALVLAGAVLGLDGDFTTVAWVAFGARVGQSFFHVLSGRSLVVNIRFTHFLVQLICYAVLAYMVLAEVL